MFQEEVHQHRDLTLKMKKNKFNSCTQENTAYTKNYIILGIQKKSLINTVRLSFKILKHKYWIIKKKMRQFDIQKEERKTRNKQSCSKAYSCLNQKTLQF